MKLIEGDNATLMMILVVIAVVCGSTNCASVKGAKENWRQLEQSQNLKDRR